jgi:double-GTPase-like protein
MPADAEVVEGSPEVEKAPVAHQLRGSDLLTAEEASRIAARGFGRMVIWAGERRSGKTTLSAQLYERHRDGRAGTEFAGSETLLGFEQRMHPSRASSGRIEPYTQRTELDPEGRDLLHLAVRQPTEGLTDLLIADVPGEVFRQLRDRERDVASVPLLNRADKLAVLIDGEMLSKPGERSSAVSFTRQLIESLRSGGLHASEMDVVLLTTKLDKLRDEGLSAERYWDERESDLLDELRQLSPGAFAVRVAARGLGDTVGDDGMEQLVEWLLEDPPDPPEAPVATTQPAARIQRIRQPRGASK